MMPIVLSALFFSGIHPLISGSGLRARLVAALGEARYRLLFSLLSLSGIISLGLAYHSAPVVSVWTPPSWLRHFSGVLMLLAFFFVVCGVMTKGPTSMGRQKLLREAEPARGIVRVTRHPFLIGVAIWAIAHLLVLGDLASFLFFGAFLFLGLTGPGRIDRRHRQTFGSDWKRFEDATSIIPFAAIIQGRNVSKFKEIGLRRVAVAIALFAVFFFFAHRFLFGVSPLVSSFMGD